MHSPPPPPHINQDLGQRSRSPLQVYRALIRDVRQQLMKCVTRRKKARRGMTTVGVRVKNGELREII